MTKYLCDHATKTLKEVATMEKPNFFPSTMWADEQKHDWDAYHKHIAALKQYSMPSMPESWNGQVKIEGVDFKIENSSPCGDDGCYEDKCCKPIAILVTPKRSEPNYSLKQVEWLISKFICEFAPHHSQIESPLQFINRSIKDYPDNNQKHLKIYKYEMD